MSTFCSPKSQLTERLFRGYLKTSEVNIRFRLLRSLEQFAVRSAPDMGKGLFACALVLCLAAAAPLHAGRDGEATLVSFVPATRPAQTARWSEGLSSSFLSLRRSYELYGLVPTDRIRSHQLSHLSSPSRNRSH